MRTGAGLLVRACALAHFSHQEASEEIEVGVGASTQRILKDNVRVSVEDSALERVRADGDGGRLHLTGEQWMTRMGMNGWSSWLAQDAWTRSGAPLSSKWIWEIIPRESPGSCESSPRVSLLRVPPTARSGECRAGLDLWVRGTRLSANPEDMTALGAGSKTFLSSLSNRGTAFPVCFSWSPLASTRLLLVFPVLLPFSSHGPASLFS